jgi:hypothetical protein
VEWVNLDSHHQSPTQRQHIAARPPYAQLNIFRSNCRIQSTPPFIQSVAPAHLRNRPIAFSPIVFRSNPAEVIFSSLDVVLAEIVAELGSDEDGILFSGLEIPDRTQ